MPGVTLDVSHIWCLWGWELNLLTAEALEAKGECVCGDSIVLFTLVQILFDFAV